MAFSQHGYSSLFPILTLKAIVIKIGMIECNKTCHALERTDQCCDSLHYGEMNYT